MTDRKIGRYEIRDELGEGGMGTVYLGFDPTLEREVAIKVLSPQLFMQDAEFSTRFEREAKTIASLDHSCIVPIYEFGEDEEWLYFVMRYMKGGTLNDRIKKGPMSLSDSILIISRIGAALNKAHSRDIVHRDLKPGNILFDEDNNAYLSDFGIVKMEDTTGIKTQTGQTLGTPHYMSPEQLDGKPLDGRSDIYSLGVILFEMLSGEKPFDHDSLPRIMVMHLTQPVPNILDKVPDLPGDIDNVIKKAMAKDPDDRYATAEELVNAMQDVESAKKTKQPVPPLPPPEKPKPEDKKPPVRETAVPNPKPPTYKAPPQPTVDNTAETVDDVSDEKKKKGMPTWLKIILILILLTVCSCIGLYSLLYISDCVMYGYC
ncbi:MAG: serine/threonine protein kinase [Anaerolineae bacterium]|nr:serine/threonine protein kinase [Anaerolineae bacterium]